MRSRSPEGSYPGLYLLLDVRVGVARPLEEPVVLGYRLVGLGDGLVGLLPGVPPQHARASPEEGGEQDHYE
jgi:hypothetical protein